MGGREAAKEKEEEEKEEVKRRGEGLVDVFLHVEKGSGEKRGERGGERPLLLSPFLPPLLLGSNPKKVVCRNFFSLLVVDRILGRKKK